MTIRSYFQHPTSLIQQKFCEWNSGSLSGWAQTRRIRSLSTDPVAEHRPGGWAESKPPSANETHEAKIPLFQRGARRAGCVKSKNFTIQLCIIFLLNYQFTFNSNQSNASVKKNDIFFVKKFRCLKSEKIRQIKEKPSNRSSSGIFRKKYRFLAEDFPTWFFGSFASRQKNIKIELFNNL